MKLPIFLEKIKFLQHIKKILFLTDNLENEKNIEAKQYLISLKQSYQAEDDIASMIESRLETLENLINN